MNDCLKHLKTSSTVSFFQMENPQTHIVMSEPGQLSAAPVHRQLPSEHKVLAWFTCLCCCWPFGMAAIRKSNEVGTHFPLSLDSIQHLLTQIKLSIRQKANHFPFLDREHRELGNFSGLFIYNLSICYSNSLSAQRFRW